MKIEKNIFSSIGFANGFSGNDKLAFNLLPSKGVPLGQTGPPRRIGKQGGRSRKTASAYSLAEIHIGLVKDAVKLSKILPFSFFVFAFAFAF